MNKSSEKLEFLKICAITIMINLCLAILFRSFSIAFISGMICGVYLLFKRKILKTPDQILNEDREETKRVKK